MTKKQKTFFDYLQKLKTEEEYFRKTYPDFCYSSGKPLSPYWDLFQYGVEFGERQSEKKIEEFEKENAEQKEKIEVLECDNYNANCNLNLITDQLTKAIELLKEAQGYIENIDDILYDEIEQFLKEIEK